MPSLNIFLDALISELSIFPQEVQTNSDCDNLDFLSIVPQVQLNLQEEVNIYQMSKLICYLDGLQEIFKKLMIDEK